MYMTDSIKEKEIEREREREIWVELPNLIFGDDLTQKYKHTQTRFECGEHQTKFERRRAEDLNLKRI